MVKVRQFRIGEGLAAAVRAEIEQLDLGHVFACTYDQEDCVLRLVLRRSLHARAYPASPQSLEGIYGHLRIYARVRNAVVVHRRSAA